MQKQLPAWQRFFLFTIGVMLIVLPYTSSYRISTGLFLILGIFFIVEAFVQPRVGERKTPLYQMVGRFTRSRDRLVAGIALAVFVSALYLGDSLLGVIIEHANVLVRLLLFAVVMLLSLMLYFAIGMYLGSQELREVFIKSLIPRFLKNLVEQRNKEENR